MIKRIVSTAFDVFPITERPMALCSVLSAAAILFIFYHGLNSVSILILFAIVSAFLCFVCRSKKSIIVSLLFLAVCASTVNELATAEYINSLDGQTVTADFIAVEDQTSYGSASSFTAYCYNSDVLYKNMKFTLHHFSDATIACGDKFRATVKILALDDEYKLRNYGDGIYSGCRIVSIDENYYPGMFFVAVGRVRKFIVNTICKNFTGDIAGILIALNSGDKSYLSGEFYSKVLVCGISHIMVVSGLHLSIIIGSLFRAFEKVFYNRFLKSAVSLVMIFIICALCGFRLSVLRAGVMFVFAAVSPLFLRKNDPLNSLGAAVMFLLYISPLCIFSVAFQLSVLSTLAIVWVAPFYSELIIDKLRIKTKIGKSAVSAFAVSIGAMIFTAPISMFVFGKISLLSPITFILVTFPVTYALEFNTAALVLSAVGAISFLAKPLFLISGINALYIKFIIDNLGLLDFMVIKADVTQFVIAIFIILCLICGMYLSRYYKKLKRRNNCRG